MQSAPASLDSPELSAGSNRISYLQSARLAENATWALCYNCWPEIENLFILSCDGHAVQIDRFRALLPHE
jgi:hypothetical protein